MTQSTGRLKASMYQTNSSSVKHVKVHRRSPEVNTKFALAVIRKDTQYLTLALEISVRNASVLVLSQLIDVEIVMGSASLNQALLKL